MSGIRRMSIVIVGVVIVVCGVPTVVHAFGSAHYQIQEDFIGSGGGVNGSSSSYKANDSFGASFGAGDANSTSGGSGNFRTQTGPQTTDDPSLSVAVTSTSANFGSLSTTTTATQTASFKVLNYTSYGYIVSVLGSPPTNGAHALAALGGSGSLVGHEQFGINLVANSTPSVGLNPQQVPSSSFSSGAAASGYNTANQFRYASGATIAAGTQSSGETDYTISYIVNTSTVTPGGSYSSNQTFVVTGTY